MATPARPDKPQTTHTTPALLHGDSELPAPRAFPTKIEPLGAILWFIGLVRRHAFRLATYIYAILMGVARRHTFRSAILLYLVLAGVTAGATRWSFHWQAQSALYQIPYGKDGVAIVGHSYGIDLDAQTLSVQWEVVGCGKYALQTYPPAGGVWAAAGCDICNRMLDIYLDHGSEPNFSYDPSKFPLVRKSPYNSSDESTGPLYVNTLNVFNVEHNIDYLIRQEMTPFDSYDLTAFMFMIEKPTHTPVPIVVFAASEGPHNFVVSSSQTRTYSNFTYKSDTGPITIKVESAVIRIQVKRSKFSGAFTLCLVLINSTLTIGSAYITLLVVVRRERMNDSLLLLPVTVVLTIPALRNLYVGSPPFGIYIDAFGFLLPMIIVAICSVVLLYTVTKSSAKGKQASQDSSQDNGMV